MFRVGFGYDAHRLSSERDLILGGVTIPHSSGLMGHSDADVLVHAVMDAILGALAMGDIGSHFPDTDEQYKGASSLALMEKVMDICSHEGYCVNNLDATIVAQSPRLSPYVQEMREKIAQVLLSPVERISIKATTTERMGFSGRKEGMEAFAVVSLMRKEQVRDVETA